LVLGRNFMWTWVNIWWGKNINKNASPLVVAFMKAFAPTNKSLRLQALFVPSKSSLCFRLCILLMRVSYFKALCYGVSKWRLFICQSICGLCRTSQNNPMIRLLKNEMTLRITLLVWEPMVTFNGLVSCVIRPNERL